MSVPVTTDGGDPAPVPTADPAPAPVPAQTAMGDAKCSGCDKAMGDADPIYCAGCAGKGDEEAKASAQFRSRVLALTGTATLDAAFGVVAGWREGHARDSASQAELATLRADSARREFRAVLSGLSLGQIRTGVAKIVTTLDPAKGAAMKAALDAIPDTTDGSEKAAVLDAACSIGATPAIIATVQAFAETAPAIAATPRAEPARNPVADAARIAPERAAAIDAAFGHKPGDVDKFQQSRSAAQ
jgi:hypothetical protein